MYTRCPECETVFVIEIEELKAAEGRVCCGECDRVFNALLSLTDKPDDEVLAPQDPAEQGAEVLAGAQEEGLEAQVGDLFEDAAETAENPPTGSAPWTPDESADGTPDTPSPEQLQWEQKLAELGLVGDQEGEHESPATGDEIEADEETSEPEEAAAESADWLQPVPAERRPWPWALAAVLAGLALLAQAAHYWREDLAGIAPLKPWVEQFYRAVGSPLPEHWDVRDYLVERGAVSDHPDIAGTLLVNAVVGNAGARPMPYPLLKVTLLDRWGEAIGERYFAPGEYLEEPAPARALLSANERAAASVLIVDPGQGAVSYGIDACLRDADNRLSCAHQDAS